MSIVSAKDILIEATKGKYAVGAFNITSLVQLEAVVEVATQKKAPVIIQTSVKPAKFYHPDVLVAIYRTLAESAPVPVCLHLDHCTDVEFCKVCASTGYTNIMIDASKQAFEENIRQTKEVCDFAHSLSNVSVEGELGTVSGVEDQIKVAEDEAALCNPEQVLEFIEQTGVDLFAPAIGTAHGVYKTKNPKIDFERMGRISKLVNGDKVRTPLVVHGGTGLPEDYIARLIEVGGSKFNVSTELKYVLIDTTYDYINNCRDEYDPGKVDAAVLDATRQVVGRWMDTLGSSGKA
jgi:tagatose 1,6-diphosphate aldolase GatY/KbaY